MNTDLQQSLQQHFGFSQFRTGQQQVIEKLINGQSSLAIFPTGSGKSLCYQFTALQLPHITLVISPLLALMKDQLAYLEKVNIKAASIDSTMTHEQMNQVMTDARNGDLKILMISVERFKNERFRQFISQIKISMMVVDEAHCISEWGHNFRPDYLKLPQYRQQLNIPLVLLLTATATRKVKLDMASRFEIAPQNIVQTGFYRDNLKLQVLATAEQDKNLRLIELIRQQEGAGIVYVTLQQTAETIAAHLIKHGINALAYHAGMVDEQRQACQNSFMDNKVDVVVATIAFGMGVDKSNIRFVIHYDLPKSIENYSQEIGRAGRDGQPSNCMTLANLDGLTTVENFVYGDTPELTSLAAVTDDIKQNTTNGLWECQINQLSTASNIRQLPLKTLLVQLELMDVLSAKYAYYADFKYKFNVGQQVFIDKYEGERRIFIEHILNATSFKKIWGTLDINLLQSNYQCDRARVVSAMDYFAEQGFISLESKKITDVYQVLNLSNVEQLNQQLFDYFSHKSKKEISRIATMIRFFELDSCLSYQLARYFDDMNAPEHCGQCSVCLGKPAKLAISQIVEWPQDELIITAVNQLIQQGDAKGYPISLPLACHFLAGLTAPWLTKLQARKISGYGICQHHRYQHIEQKLHSLTTQFLRSL